MIYHGHSYKDKAINVVCADWSISLTGRWNCWRSRHGFRTINSRCYEESKSGREDEIPKNRVTHGCTLRVEAWRVEKCVQFWSHHARKVFGESAEIYPIDA